MAAQKKISLASKFGRRLLKLLLFMFVSSFVYLFICKWVMPPITITQLQDVFSSSFKRSYVAWPQISPNIKLAAIAGEDQRFPNHAGFDWMALQKSLNSENKKRVKGAAASTISQQVAKNVFLWQGEGVMKYVRKVPEFYFTKMIEWIWGKQRILEVYLNVIQTGPKIYGVEAAAEAYFNKHASALNKKEAAMIIACLPNPVIYSVKPLSRWVSWKHQWILRQMNNLQSDKDIASLIK